MISIAAAFIINTIVAATGIALPVAGLPAGRQVKKEQWIEDLTADLLPTHYYHIVFTLPHEFNPIIMGNRKELFKLLFDAASKKLLQLSSDENGWVAAAALRLSCIPGDRT